MNYYERIQQSINYIDRNLCDDLLIEKVARQAFMSLSNYYRMFFSLTGHTVKEYIRKRRLSCASFELTHTSKAILEIALDYGFENGDTFAKAYKKVTGINPSDSRKQQINFNYERIDLMKKYYQECELDEKYPEIRVLKELPPMRVAYYNHYGLDPEINALRVVGSWLKESGLNKEKDKLRIFGYNNPSPAEGTAEYGYEVCVTIPDDYHVTDARIRTKTLPGGMYAIQGVDFKNGNVGEAIMSAWQRFNAWRKESKYVLADHQWLEEHLQFNDDLETVSEMDLYMPIRLK